MKHSAPSLWGALSRGSPPTTQSHIPFLLAFPFPHTPSWVLVSEPFLLTSSLPGTLSLKTWLSWYLIIFKDIFPALSMHKHPPTSWSGGPCLWSFHSQCLVSPLPSDPSDLRSPAEFVMVSGHHPARIDVPFQVLISCP